MSSNVVVSFEVNETTDNPFIFCQGIVFIYFENENISVFVSIAVFTVRVILKGLQIRVFSTLTVFSDGFIYCFFPD